MTRTQRRRPASDRAARTRDEASTADSLTHRRHAPDAELIRAATAYSRRQAFARVLSATPNPSHPGAFVVTIACPRCGLEHTHGADARSVRRLSVDEWRRMLRARPGDLLDPFDRPWSAGDRVAHCSAGRGGGYELVLTASDARRIRKAARA